MLNRLTPLVSLVMVITLNAQAEQITPPTRAPASNEITLSGPYNVQDLDPDDAQHLRKHVKATDELTTAGGNWWDASGSGPYPAYGGYWYEGTKMFGYTPSGAIMQTLQYYWSNSHLNGWDNQITVLLWVSDGTYAYYGDVTSQNSGTVNVSGIPANYKVSIRMKVGTLQVPLSNPPYIDYVSSSVYYTY